MVNFSRWELPRKEQLEAERAISKTAFLPKDASFGRVVALLTIAGPTGVPRSYETAFPP